jgi:hypothetical protein
MELTPQDHAELNELYARYCDGVDADDPPAIVSLFAPGGAFHRENTSVAFSERKSFIGEDALLEFFGTWSAGMSPHQHWINNVWFESAGENTVTGHASWAILHEAGGKGEILALGKYRDEVVRVDGRWRFQNRYITFAF